MLCFETQAGGRGRLQSAKEEPELSVSGPFGVRIPVTGRVIGLEQERDLHMNGKVFLPPGYQSLSSVAAVVLRPGGSHSVDYWHQAVLITDPGP
jgi:hypothetical protein